MSNKLVKNKTKTTEKTTQKQKLEKNKAFFGTTKVTNKMFDIYLNRQKKENVQKRNVIHQIISSVIIEVLVLSFAYVYKSFILAIAAILCCIITAGMSYFHYKNDENKKQNKAMIISQIIVFIIGIICIFLPGRP